MGLRRLRVLVVLVLALGSCLLWADAAGAILRGRPPTRATRGSNTELRLTSTGSGTSVNGFIAERSNPFDPVTDGYPTCGPTTTCSGFASKNESFAGVIHALPIGGGDELSLYCIDINTDTFIGYGYHLGTWDAATVPNVGYVARLLEEYYPNTNEPAALTDLNRKAAAVQAAVWFFSDRYVVSTSDPLHNAVVAIVDQVINPGRLSSRRRPASPSPRRM